MASNTGFSVQVSSLKRLSVFEGETTGSVAWPLMRFVVAAHRSR